MYLGLFVIPTKLVLGLLKKLVLAAENAGKVRVHVCWAMAVGFVMIYILGLPKLLEVVLGEVLDGIGLVLVVLL